MKKQVHTVIIGAGQSGLAVSYCLTQKKIDHVVLEKGRVAEGWRSTRWDAFRLITPNFMTCLPGFPYKGKNPKGFDSRDEMVKFFEKYAKSFHAPVIENAEVLSVTQDKGIFFVESSAGNFEAKNVIMAIGPFHKPRIPKVSKILPKNIFQIHSSEYKNPKQLPKGAVLVVGGGNSGIQIAADLNRVGRKVYLSLSGLRIVPRNYRGKDFMEWAEITGALDKTNEEATPEIKSTLTPLLWGRGETVNFRKMANNGITLLGRLTGYKEPRYTFDESIMQSIEKGEATLEAFKNAADKVILDKKINAPKAEKEKVIHATIPIITNLNGKAEDINSVIWSTGFTEDYSLLKVPVFDERKQPVHEKGVSKIPGLYFIGLRWLSKYKSFLLVGVGEDAEYIASQIS